MRILRPFDVLLIGLMIGGAVWTFQIKHKAERASDQLRKLNAGIEKEKEKIDLLNADWALLNQPEGLQKLVDKYNSALQLQPLEPGQIGALAEVPIKPIPEDPIGMLAGDAPEIDGSSTAGVGEKTEGEGQ